MDSDGIIAPKRKSGLLMAITVQEDAWAKPQISFLLSSSGVCYDGALAIDLLSSTSEDRGMDPAAFLKALPPEHAQFLEKAGFDARGMKPLVTTLPDDYVAAQPTKVLSEINIFLAQSKLSAAKKASLEEAIENQPAVYGVARTRLVSAETAYAALKEGRLSTTLGQALSSYKTVFLQGMFSNVMSELSSRSYFRYGANGAYRYDRAAIAAKSLYQKIPAWALSA